MKKIFYRQNNLFKIDEKVLSKKAQGPDVINALYVAAHEEFKGAAENPLYKDLTPLERMNKLNEFAENWLKIRGLL